jgi:hypothetical protein
MMLEHPHPSVLHAAPIVFGETGHKDLPHYASGNGFVNRGLWKNASRLPLFGISRLLQRVQFSGIFWQISGYLVLD